MHHCQLMHFIIQVSVRANMRVFACIKFKVNQGNYCMNTECGFQDHYPVWDVL